MINIVNYKDKKNKKGLIEFQERVLTDFDQLLKELISTDYKKSALLTYWLDDYKNYLSDEKHFHPSKLVNYKRGSIIKADLGFNVGYEQGGLHYCVVLNKSDTINTQILNVIPLTSIKDPAKKLHYTTVSLGNEIHDTINEQLNTKQNQLEKNLLTVEAMDSIINEILDILIFIQSEGHEFMNDNLEKNKDRILDLISKFNEILNHKSWTSDFLKSIINTVSDISQEETLNFYHLLKIVKSYTNIMQDILPLLKSQLAHTRKIIEEIGRMKKGSIAHIDQITTISKMRIHNPKSSDDALFNLKLSNESLNLIDRKIKELFTY